MCSLQLAAGTFLQTYVVQMLLVCMCAMHAKRSIVNLVFLVFIHGRWPMHIESFPFIDIDICFGGANLVMKHVLIQMFMQ
mmetsp:Transcript_109059/g.188893  ORF Transcript_109059/g.188893 Transcript_109059/m.188893 type:complete len:80 (+) Transcript_109059:1331-1570(+)